MNHHDDAEARTIAEEVAASLPLYDQIRTLEGKVRVLEEQVEWLRRFKADDPTAY